MPTIELTLPVEGRDIDRPTSSPMVRAENAEAGPTKGEVVALWRLLRRLGVPDSDADDATQEVLIVVAERRGSVPPEKLRSFVYGTALRVALGWLRKRSHESLEAAAEVADKFPLADDLMDQHKARQALDALLAEMPFELRTVLVFFEIEDLSIDEIARALNLPRGTAASRLRRAREDFAARVDRWRARRERRGGAR